MNDQSTTSTGGGFPSTAGFAFLAFALLIALALYLFFCFCCKRICQKAGRDPGILIWLPVAQVIPLLQAAGMPAWMLVMFLIPLVNLILMVMMWAKLCVACGKSAWLVLLMFVPLANLAFLPYLAFANREPGTAVLGSATANEPCA